MTNSTEKAVLNAQDTLKEVIGSQAKIGTCSVYAYATLYVIAKNQRVTLALIGVKNNYTNVAIISYLLRQINS